jgi:hypothetical protein
MMEGGADNGLLRLTHDPYDPLNTRPMTHMTHDLDKIYRVFKYNYNISSIDLSINGRMVISIQQRQQFAQYITVTVKIKILIAQWVNHTNL